MRVRFKIRALVWSWAVEGEVVGSSLDDNDLWVLLVHGDDDRLHSVYYDEATVIDVDQLDEEIKIGGTA